jgi:hypothetical protein
VRLSFEVSPPSVRVAVDGATIAAGARELVLPASAEPHLVECAAPGFRSRAVALVADRDRVISCALEPLPDADADEPPRRKRGTARRGGKRRRPGDLGLAANPF